MTCETFREIKVCWNRMNCIFQQSCSDKSPRCSSLDERRSCTREDRAQEKIVHKRRSCTTEDKQKRKAIIFAFLFQCSSERGLEEGSLLEPIKYAGSRVCPNFVFKKYSTLANVCYIRIKIKIKEIIAAIRKNFM